MRTILIRIALTISAAAGGVIVTSVDDFYGMENSDSAIQSNMTYEEAVTFADYALYELGATFEGLARSSIMRGSNVTTPWDPYEKYFDYVSFSYGDCTPDDSDDEELRGCEMPLEVQTTPLCLVGVAEPDYPAWILAEREPVTINGQQWYFYDEGRRLEGVVSRSNTGEVVSIYGNDRDRMIRAAGSLQRINPAPSDTPPLCYY